MAVILSFANQKGGCGKTSTCECVSAVLGAKGKRVLAVDMDSQANLTFISGTEPQHTIIDVLAEDVSIKQAICKCAHYDILPGDNRLINLESMEIDVSTLKDILEEVSEDYDFITLDTPPMLGVLLRVSLYASNFVVVPLDAKPLSIKGLDLLEATVAEVKELKILGICLIKYHDRSVINRQLKEILADRAKDMGTTLFDTYIRESVSLVEAQTTCQSLIDYAPKAKPTQDYYSLTDEILQRLKEN